MLPTTSDLGYRALVGVQLPCAPRAFGPGPALEQGEPDSLPGHGGIDESSYSARLPSVAEKRTSSLS